MPQLLTLRGALEEIIPALSAAGWSNDRIRGAAAETARRMGPGGMAQHWVLTMGEVVGESGDELAMAAFLLAIDEWKRPIQ